MSAVRPQSAIRREVLVRSIELLSNEIEKLEAAEDFDAERDQGVKVAMIAESMAEHFLQLRHVALFATPSEGLRLERLIDPGADAEKDANAGVWKFVASARA